MSESEERSLVEALHALEREHAALPPAGPPDAYWQNLIIRTNQRIDGVSSGKALSISWAARVAIPGVVAILSFLVGLHYFVPTRTAPDKEVVSAVLSLPDSAVDSLLTETPFSGDALATVAAEGNFFEVPPDQIADYLIENETTGTLVESLPEKQVNEVMDLLAANN